MSRFAIVPVQVMEALAGDSTAVSVYAALASHADREGWCNPRQATLASMLGVSEVTVRRKIKKLIAAGLVDRKPILNGRKVGNQYWLAERSPVIVPQPITGDRSTRAREPLIPKERNRTDMEQEKQPRHLEAVTPIHAGRLLDHPSDPERVIVAWLDATGREHRAYHFTPKRERKLRQLLEVGFTAEDLIDAARGVMKSPWYTGANPDGSVMTGFDNVFKDEERVQLFMELEREPKVARQGRRRQGGPESPLEQVARVFNMRRSDDAGDRGGTSSGADHVGVAEEDPGRDDAGVERAPGAAEPRTGDGGGA